MKYLSLLFIAATFAASAQENSMKNFLWLSGTWKQTNKEEYEKWQQINDTMMGGISYHYAQEEHDKDETDIFFDESIRLVARGANYFYVPKVRNQNKGKEIEFRITFYNAKSFTAECPTHDFPQRIVYRLKDPEHLDATICGHIDGKMKKIKYQFVKIK